jgi:long-chain fatty acid transport protein
MKKLQFCLPLLALLGALSKPESAFASGFAIIEQSVPGLGSAFAGAAATAEDPTTIFFNPAGLTRLDGISTSSAVYGIFPAARFKNEGSTIFNGFPLIGNNGGDAGVDALLPNFYAAVSLSDRLKLGLGVNAPFALATYYKNGWVGRYQGIESRLSTLNISPVIAYKLTNNLSVGGGVDIQYASAVLSNAIDFGLIGFAAGLRTRPQTADGFVKIAGQDWSVGYNLALLYEPTPTTRVGLTYRSRVNHTLKGVADFTVPAVAAPLTARGRFRDTDATAELKLPDSLSLAIRQEVSPKVALLADVTWTNWSRV